MKADTFGQFDLKYLSKLCFWASKCIKLARTEFHIDKGLSVKLP